MPGKTSWTLIPVTPDTPSLKEAAELGRAAAAAASGRSRGVGAFRFAKSVDGRFSVVRSRETPLGDFTADAMKIYTGADIGIMNGGSIRIGRIVPAGEFTESDFAVCFPFRNYIVKIYVTGAEIRRLLEKSASALAAPGEVVDFKERPHTGEFMQVSGLRLVIDLTKKAAKVRNNILTEMGERVSGVEVFQNGRWEKLDDNKIYTAGMTDFIARTVGSLYVTPTGTLTVDVVKAYAASLAGRQADVWDEGCRITIIGGSGGQ